MIEIKAKKCKGTGKAIGYGCGKLTKHRQYGLGKMCCYSDWLLNAENGKIHLEKITLKITKPRLDLEKVKLESKKNKSLSYLIQNTVNACHEWIRLRDKGKNCISCDKPWHSDFQAGHFYKAELYSSLKLDETNINGQCQGCNLYKEGNESGYRVGLINRYSKGFLDLLDSKALLDKQKGFKWDRIKLKKKYEYYKKKIKDYDTTKRN